MADFIMSEVSGTLKALYGEYLGPIVSHVDAQCEAWQEKEIFSLIFREQKIDGFGGAYTATTAMDNWLPVGENADFPTNGKQMAYDKLVRDVEWESEFAVTKKMIEDQQMGRALKDTTDFVNAFYRSREMFFAQFLGAAGTGSSSFTLNGIEFDLKSADGQNLFSKTHPRKVKGGNQTNMYADAFSGEAWSKAITHYQNLEGDKGEMLALCPDTLIIPNDQAMKDAACAYVNSHNVPGSDHNDANPGYGSQRIIIWPYLNQFIGANKPWFIMDSRYNDVADGLVFQNRLDLEITPTIGDRLQAIFKGRARYTGAAVNWRAIMAGGMTGGSSL